MSHLRGEHDAAVVALRAARQLGFDRPRARAGAGFGQPVAQLRAADAGERQHGAVALQRQPRPCRPAFAGRAQRRGGLFGAAALGAARNSRASAASARISCNCSVERVELRRCIAHRAPGRLDGHRPEQEGAKHGQGQPGQARSRAPRRAPTRAQRAPLRRPRVPAAPAAQAALTSAAPRLPPARLSETRPSALSTLQPPGRSRSRNCTICCSLQPGADSVSRPGSKRSVCTGPWPSGQADAAAPSRVSRSVSPARPAAARSTSVSRCICSGASSTARTSERWRAAAFPAPCAARPAPAAAARPRHSSRPICSTTSAARPKRTGRQAGLSSWRSVVRSARVPRCRGARSNWRRFHSERTACSARSASVSTRTLAPSQRSAGAATAGCGGPARRRARSSAATVHAPASRPGRSTLRPLSSAWHSTMRALPVAAPTDSREVALRRIPGPAGGQHALDAQPALLQIVQLVAQPGLVRGRDPRRLRRLGTGRQRQVQCLVVLEQLVFEHAAQRSAQVVRPAPWAA